MVLKFSFLHKISILVLKISICRPFRALNLSNVKSNCSPSIMYHTLYHTLYHTVVHVVHSFEKCGTFYVGEPLKLRNSMTKVLESYPWNRDFEPKPWKFPEISCLVWSYGGQCWSMSTICRSYVSQCRSYVDQCRSCTSQ